MAVVDPPNLKKRKALTDEQILEALDAMGRGERPPEPDAPAVRAMSADPVEIEAQPEAPARDPSSEVVDTGPVRGPEVVGADVHARSRGAPVQRGDEGPEEESSIKEALKQTIKSNPYKTSAEIEGIIKDLEDAQARDRRGNAIDRIQAWNVKAGSALSSGMGGLQENNVPMPPRTSRAADVANSASLKDKLQTGEQKRQNPEQERNLKELLETMKLVEDLDKNNKKIKATKEEHEAARTYDEGKTNKVEGGKMERAKIMSRTQFGTKAMGIDASKGNQTARSDAEFASRQAERQIPMYRQLKANSATDQTQGAELSGSMKGMEDKAGQMIQVMRKYGRNFPQSTEWKNLASDYMAINQLLNRLNQNGVMNFKDKDNNDVQIGNAQEFVQYVLGNGPDVLEHSVKSMRLITNARMFQHGYEYDPNWKAQTPKDYMGQTTGGNLRTGVDPNAAPAAADWAITGKNPPKFNNPAQDIKGGQPGSHGALVKESKNFREYADGYIAERGKDY